MRRPALVVAAVTVRVRPALAGEGRYFVLVPPGTIQDAPTQFEDDDEIDSEDLEDMKLEFFKMSLLDDEERAARVAHLFPDMDLNVDKPQRSESPVAGKVCAWGFGLMESWANRTI
jgi:hypothetical protein